jgi:recombinational DNA repair protein (RecF pathway)
MAIEKYTTEGIVLESYDQGEHDRVYKIYTREFGLIIAHARSIRKLESKLRPHILPRSVTLVTLVKGKEVWRITGAEKKITPYTYIQDVVLVTKRFIRGEGSNKALYDRLVAILQLEGSYNQEHVKLLIHYVVLVALGYADARVIGARTIKEYASYSVDDLYTHLLLAYDEVRKHTIGALKDTQL